MDKYVNIYNYIIKNTVKIDVYNDIINMLFVDDNYYSEYANCDLAIIQNLTEYIETKEYIFLENIENICKNIIGIY
ncbi:hypothetical protein CHBEV_266 [Choristoneura biennis entomopoxvirus]|uniref:Uncharacterized protein n=1 Tax=Choristoneura biennis entomopoxvirus TaxID=10288 RepID=A0A916KPT6_CBEPV|nr:hypothetical protein CHBEV_266 [Choristoneura biennis entomopoxvirus]CCU55834.1 hypothetical protein CHBEV_266 [Choristoneura biennis entomopoxvirus]